MRHQIGITFPGATGMREGMIHQVCAQRNTDIRSHRDTCISDASGVLNETPKGGKRSDPGECESGGFLPARITSGSHRGD